MLSPCSIFVLCLRSCSAQGREAGSLVGSRVGSVNGDSWFGDALAQKSEAFMLSAPGRASEADASIIQC